MSSNIKQKPVWRQWLESIITAFILALIIRSFIIEPFKIPSGSMEPTLKVGDKILVNKFIYGARIPFTNIFFPKIREPQTGDIMVFIYPVNPKKDFIKRVIAKGGDTVEIRNGNIYINGKLCNYPVIRDIYYYNVGPYGKDKIIVPEGHFYVLGDNSGNSKDSRFWGFVPEENRIGKAFLIWWPPHRIRLLK